MDILWTYYGNTIANYRLLWSILWRYYGCTVEVLWDTIEQTIDYYGVYYGRTMDVLCVIKQSPIDFPTPCMTLMPDMNPGRTFLGLITGAQRPMHNLETMWDPHL